MGGLGKTTKQFLAPVTAISTAISSLLGDSPSGTTSSPAGATTPPPVEKPPVIPTPDDEVVNQAKRRSIAAQMQRRGRASTILSDLATPSDKLGG